MDIPGLSDEQLEVYLGLLREHAHLEEDELDEALGQLLTGTDCMLKLLLILLCPRLNSFKQVDGSFVWYVRHHIS
jgi:hypothetical protein